MNYISSEEMEITWGSRDLTKGLQGSTIIAVVKDR